MLFHVWSLWKTVNTVSIKRDQKLDGLILPKWRAVAFLSQPCAGFPAVTRRLAAELFSARIEQRCAKPICYA
jgi:hypothetical protein